MAQPLTKTHLKALHDAIRAEMRQSTKEIIGDQRESTRPIKKGLQELREQMGEANTKLDAIMSGDVLVTRSQLLRVLEKLKAQGFKIDEREIFAA